MTNLPPSVCTPSIDKCVGVLSLEALRLRKNSRKEKRQVVNASTILFEKQEKFFPSLCHKQQKNFLAAGIFFNESLEIGELYLKVVVFRPNLEYELRRPVRRRRGYYVVFST